MAATATAPKPAPRSAASARRAPRATAARAAARRSPARAARPAPRQPRPAPRLVPVAVGRTAIAVGGIADSGLVLRLTRSRLWIGVLGTLLVGIVGLNVFALSFNAAASKTAGISDELRRENSALRAEIADGLSNERLQSAAARLGLVIPEPGAIHYLNPTPGDAADAAERLRKGAITVGSTYVPAAQPVTPVAPVIEEAPAAPAEQTTPETTVTPEAATPEATAAATPPATAGGITP